MGQPRRQTCLRKRNKAKIKKEEKKTSLDDGSDSFMTFTTEMTFIVIKWQHALVMETFYIISRVHIDKRTPS